MDSLTFDFDQTTTTGQSEAGATSVIPRATVRDMVKRRGAALDAFADAHRIMSDAASCLPAAWVAYQAIGGAKENSYTKMTEQEDKNFLHHIKIPPLSEFTENARKVVDRRMWSTLVEMTDLERIMDKQAKDQMRQGLMDNVPEATEENIFATIQQFALDGATIFQRGMANCFSQLDRRFKSHDGWKIGSRIVLTYAFDSRGSWSFHRNMRDTLHDIDRVFHVLDGGTTPELYGGIVSEVEKSRQGQGYGPRQSECESEYFKIRGFKNGNAHVWFKRDDLVAKVNKMLGEYYGNAIPEEREAKADPLNTAKTSLAKNYGFFPTPDKAADQILEYLPLHRERGAEPPTVLEPSAGTGNLARRAAKAGAIVDCVEYQPHLAEGLKQGRLYRRVWTGDFLRLQPDAGRLYDRIIMNPPFDRERDIDHVMHALRFLKSTGCLVAIMSAGTEFRETAKATAFREHIKAMGGTWRDLPAGSFSSVGTNVNTIALRVWADKRHQYGM